MLIAIIIATLAVPAACVFVCAATLGLWMLVGYAVGPTPTAVQRNPERSYSADEEAASRPGAVPGLPVAQ